MHTQVHLYHHTNAISLVPRLSSIVQLHYAIFPRGMTIGMLATPHKSQATCRIVARPSSGGTREGLDTRLQSYENYVTHVVEQLAKVMTLRPDTILGDYLYLLCR